jgi:hypothetical protein
MDTVFKDCFHKADFGPDEPVRYVTPIVMSRKMEDYQMNKMTLSPFEMISSMGAMEKLTLDRRVVDDAFEAYASISLFYEADDLLKSEHGDIHWIFEKLVDEYFLLDQVERAKHVPDRRTSRSNKQLPKGFWDEWDRLCKAHGRTLADGMIEHFYPPEWDIVVRPIIARCTSVVVIVFRALQTHMPLY